LAQFQIDTDWHWDSWIPSVALLDTSAEYNKQADRRSWIAMQDFFKEIFA
jgi:hypothetical protein